MDIFETLLKTDTYLFLLINGFHNVYFDKFMFTFSEKLVWIPFYLIVILEIIKQKKHQSVWLILALILCLVLSDQISSSIIKDSIQRLRPSQNEDLINLIHLVNGYKGGKYGFVSSHAANTMGFALLSSLIFKNRIYTFIVFCWVVITSYSRIYLGVHYPADIIGGLLVGSIVALLCYSFLIKYKGNLVSSFDFSHTTKLTLSSKILLITIASISIYALL